MLSKEDSKSKGEGYKMRATKVYRNREELTVDAWKKDHRGGSWM